MNSLQLEFHQYWLRITAPNEAPVCLQFLIWPMLFQGFGNKYLASDLYAVIPYWFWPSLSQKGSCSGIIFSKSFFTEPFIKTQPCIQPFFFSSTQVPKKDYRGCLRINVADVYVGRRNILRKNKDYPYRLYFVSKKPGSTRYAFGMEDCITICLVLYHCGIAVLQYP